jgi:hypothetical protein
MSSTRCNFRGSSYIKARHIRGRYDPRFNFKGRYNFMSQVQFQYMKCEESSKIALHQSQEISLLLVFSHLLYL